MAYIDIPGYGRKNYPDTMSDDEILRDANSLIGKGKQEEPDIDVRDFPASYIAKQGAARSLEQVKGAGLELLPSMGAKALGYDDYAKRKMDEYQTRMREMEEAHPTAFKSFHDIRDISDIPKYATEAVSEQAYNIPTMLGPGIAGRIGGGMLAKSLASKGLEEAALARAAEAGLTGEAAEAYAANLAEKRLGMAGLKGAEAGMTAGLGAGAAALNVPETYEQIYSDTGQLHPGVAAAFGGVKSILDTIVPGHVLNQLSPAGKSRLAFGLIKDSNVFPTTWKRAFATEVAKDAAGEGLTEGAQQTIDNLASNYAGAHKDLLDNVGESIVRGAIGGGAVSTPGAAIQAGRIKDARQAEIDRREQLLNQQEQPQGQQEQQEQPLDGQPSWQPPEYKETKFGLLPAPPVPTDYYGTQGGPTFSSQEEADAYQRQQQEQAFRDQYDPEKAFATQNWLASNREALRAAQLRREGTKAGLKQSDMFAEDLAQPPVAPGPQPGEGYLGQIDVGPAERPRGASTVIDADRLKATGLNPRSPYFKQLLGKDISDPAQLKDVKNIVSKVRANSVLAKSTKTGVEEVVRGLMPYATQEGFTIPRGEEFQFNKSGLAPAARAPIGGSGESTGVPSQPEPSVPTEGTGVSETGGVAPTQPVPSGPIGGTPSQPGALTPPEQKATPVETAPEPPTIPARDTDQTGFAQVKKFLTQRSLADQKVKPTTVGEAIQHHLDTVPDSAYKSLAERLTKIPHVASTPISYTQGEPGEQGKFNAKSGSIEIHDGGGWHAVFHEAVHAATVKGYTQDRDLRQSLDMLHTKVVKQAKADGKTSYYGLSTPMEFLAEAETNPEFQDYLKSIEFNKNQSLWDRLVNVVKHYLNKIGIRGKDLNTALDAAFGLSEASMQRTAEAGEVGLTDAEQKIVGSQTLQLPSNFSSPNAPFQTVQGVDAFIDKVNPFGASQASALSSAIHGATGAVRSGILSMLPTHALSDVAKGAFPPGMAEAYHSVIRDQDGYLHGLLDKAVDVNMAKLRKARKDAPKQQNLFNKLAAESTKYGVDPTDAESMDRATKFSMGYLEFNPDGTEKGMKYQYFDSAEARKEAIKAHNKSKPEEERSFAVKDPDIKTKQKAEEVRRMYSQLRESWKDLYKSMRNTNQAMLKEFKDSICNRIDEAEHLDHDTKIFLKKNLLTRLAEAGVIHPYFSLGREGDHWLAAEVPNEYGAYESFVTAFKDPLSRSKVETDLKNKVYAHELKKNLGRGMPQNEAKQAAYNSAVKQVRVYSNINQIDYRRMSPGSTINEILGIIESKKPARKAGESEEAYQDNVQRFNDIEHDIMQMVINALPETAFVKNLQKRKNTPGHLEDMVDVFERKTRSSARQIANLKFKPKLSKALDDMRDYTAMLGKGMDEVRDPNTGEITQESVLPKDNSLQAAYLNEFEKHASAIFNPSPKNVSGIIKSALFGGTLGFNVSSGLIALSNLPMIVFPYLGAEYGTQATRKAMGEAHKIIRNSGNYRKVRALGSEEANDVSEEAMKSGWSFGNYGPNTKIGKELATLYDVASRSGQLNRSQLYENLLGSARTTPLDKFNAMSGWMLHTAERYNREVTLVAAYKLELAKLKKQGITGEEAEIRAANKAVYDAEMANGSISASSAPRIAQGDLGSIVYMYKRFGVTQYYLQAKTLYDALKGETDPKVRKMLKDRFWSLTGATALMSGVQGLPMFGLAAMVYNLFKDDDEEDFNMKMRRLMPEYVYNGPVDYLTGLSVASRTGLSNLIIKEPRSSGESSSFSQTLLDSVGGPFPSMVDRFQRGLDKIQKGNVERGIEDLFPVAVANALKGVRYMTEGAKTLRGDTIYDDIGPGHAMMQVLGFTPSEVAKRMEFNAKQKGLSQAEATKESHIKSRYYKAYREHDREGMQEARQDLLDFGTKHPDLGHTPGTVDKTLKESLKYHEGHTKKILMGNEYPNKHLKDVHDAMKDLDIEP